MQTVAVVTSSLPIHVASQWADSDLKTYLRRCRPTSSDLPADFVPGALHSIAQSVAEVRTRAQPSV